MTARMQSARILPGCRRCLLRSASSVRLRNRSPLSMNFSSTRRACSPSTSTRNGAVGQLQQLQDSRDDADRDRCRSVGRVIVGRIHLCDEQDLAAALLDFLQRAYGFVSAHKERRDHLREHHDVAQRQDGEDVCRSLSSPFSPLSPHEAAMRGGSPAMPIDRSGHSRKCGSVRRGSLQVSLRSTTQEVHSAQIQQNCFGA